MQRESGAGKEPKNWLINGKQHSVWFAPTGMKGLPQNVLLNFRLEFPKSDFTIYLPSGISEIFCQMVSTLGRSRQEAARVLHGLPWRRIKSEIARAAELSIGR